MKMSPKNIFDQIASVYDQSAYLSEEIAKRMLERLDLFRIQPKSILELGCATGSVTQQLAKRYSAAEIVAIDISEAMLNLAQQKCQAHTHINFICADAEKLTLPDHSSDLIISHLMLPWCKDPAVFFESLQRLLKPEGVLLFTTYGPDTLMELGISVPFRDMHDIGDDLLRAGFKDPVVDAEIITVHYQESAQLISDIKNQGGECLLPNGNIDISEQAIDVTCEVIYGHAIGQIVYSQRIEGDEVLIPTSSIKYRSEKE